MARPDHALAGCRAALANQARLAQLRRDFATEGFPEVRCRIGLNSGQASIGNMGSARRFSYTAMGDNINLASRLEGANKAYGTYLMISESTRRQAGDAIAVRELDFIKVKGKNLPIKVYEMLGLQGETEAGLLDKARGFEAALALYRDRRFPEAAQAFAAVATACGTDAACDVYIARCRKFQEHPPEAAWDGTWTMKEK